MGDNKDEVIAGYEKKATELKDYLHNLEAAFEKHKLEAADREAQLNREKAELQSLLNAALGRENKLEIDKTVLIKEREFWQRYSGAPRTYAKSLCTCGQPKCCLQVHKSYLAPPPAKPEVPPPTDENEES